MFGLKNPGNTNRFRLALAACLLFAAVDWWSLPALAEQPFSLGQYLSHALGKFRGVEETDPIPFEPVACPVSSCSSGADLIPTFQPFFGEPLVDFVRRDFRFQGRPIDAATCEKAFSGEINVMESASRDRSYLDLFEVCEGLAPAGMQYLLRFSISAVNISAPDPSGINDFIVGGFAPEGDPTCGGNSSYVYSPTHGHCHLKNLYSFELVDPKSGDLVAGKKMSFATVDSTQFCEEAGPFQYGFETQGITPGWVDIYGSFLPGNYIVVTEVPAGDYILRATLNFDDVEGLASSDCDTANNTIEMDVRLPPKKAFRQDYAPHLLLHP